MDVVAIVVEKEGTHSASFPDFPFVVASAASRGEVGQIAARVLGEHVRAMRGRRMRVPIPRTEPELRADEAVARAFAAGATTLSVRIPD